ncbi:MAG: single-stranded DNA-binding protein [Nocardioides sp.]|nr:single-stranded DNA-binding protein [Nocardioides sp.]MDP3891697.1 single-stranded DNA-binding protein [Nocardioides sp.]
MQLRGRVSSDPEERGLPSGDVVWTFRVVVPRVRGRSGSRQAVDTIECTAWSARARRSVAAWRAGDVVEVSGSIRRRFFRAGGTAASRVEVEMVSGRRVRRSASS